MPGATGRQGAKEVIAYDLCCGLGGWSEGFLAEGYTCIGYDIESHEYGTEKYPGELRLKSILDLHGSELADATAIVASPPCQKYSYMAMPWTKAKDLVKWYREIEQRQVELNALFEACFRIQREANTCPECHGINAWRCGLCKGKVPFRNIPMVVENVKGAQPWVGRAAWHYGSFYLWGDVPALMPTSLLSRKSRHIPLCETPKGVGSTSWFHGNSKHEGRFYGTENDLRLAISRRTSSRSTARKAASAMIAKIPFELSSHIARCFKPRKESAA